MFEKNNQKLAERRKDLETALRNAGSWSRKRWQQETRQERKIN